MSDVDPGGWWQASDGRWYPPELHPSAAAATGGADPVIPAGGSLPAGHGGPGRSRRTAVIVLVVAVVLVAGVAGGVLALRPAPSGPSAVADAFVHDVDNRLDARISALVTDRAQCASQVDDAGNLGAASLQVAWVRTEGPEAVAQIVGSACTPGRRCHTVLATSRAADGASFPQLWQWARDGGGPLGLLALVEKGGHWYVDVQPGPPSHGQTATQSDLTNALVSATAIYAETQSFPATAMLRQKLAATQTTITFVTGTQGPAPGKNSLSVATVGSNLVVFSGVHAAGACWYAADNESDAAIGQVPPGDHFSGKARGRCAARAAVTPGSPTLVPAVRWRSNFRDVPGVT